MTRDPNPLVSVVIPCLNRAHYLVPTIESVLGQDYPHIECIVVDGGSTDNTAEILGGYGDSIRWISEPDEGHADAINKGWRMSTGDILAWLNADDVYVVPDAVGKAVEFLGENPEVDVVYGDYTAISEEGRAVSGIIKPRRWDFVYAVKKCDHIICQPSSFMRRSILEKVGWLDQEFRNGKDHELWLRIGLADGVIRYAPLHLAFCRLSPGLTRQIDMGEAKVAVNRKFFSLPDLPYPFTSPRFRKRAMSNACLVGARYILAGTGRIRPSLPLISQAFETDPLNALWGAGIHMLYYLYLLLPDSIQGILRTIRTSVRNRRRSNG
ncbi:glycosyltransferase [bacterium]|nr:glycosyltransferase [bacterium]